MLRLLVQNCGSYIEVVVPSISRTTAATKGAFLLITTLKETEMLAFLGVSLQQRRRSYPFPPSPFAARKFSSSWNSNSRRKRARGKEGRLGLLADTFAFCVEKRKNPGPRFEFIILFVSQSSLDGTLWRSV